MSKFGIKVKNWSKFGIKLKNWSKYGFLMSKYVKIWYRGQKFVKIFQNFGFLRSKYVTDSACQLLLFTLIDVITIDHWCKLMNECAFLTR